MKKLADRIAQIKIFITDSDLTSENKKTAENQSVQNISGMGRQTSSTDQAIKGLESHIGNGPPEKNKAEKRTL